MRCEQWQEQALDVLYGEQVDPRTCYDFFRHLDDCPACDHEYRHLLEARELLGSWTVQESELANLDEAEPLFNPGAGSWWNRRGFVWLRQVAAAVLVTLGLFTLFQQARLLGESRVEVSEQQLIEMVNDLIVQHENSERRLIGQQWMDFADDLSLQQKALARDVAQQLYQLEARYLEQLEQNNQYMQALYSREGD